MCLHLTSGASICPENTVMYSVGNGGPNICGVFSETTLLQRSSTPPLKGHTYSWPFSVESTHVFYSPLGGVGGSAL